MSDYWKNRESHLKAQKKYDDKNREKKREYDKKRWQRYKQLQNNWNELKKWCKENQYIGKTITFENDVTYTEILEKMQELEQGKDE